MKEKQIWGLPTGALPVLSIPQPSDKATERSMLIGWSGVFIFSKALLYRPLRMRRKNTRASHIVGKVLIIHWASCTSIASASK